jgi:hypothetical protein
MQSTATSQFSTAISPHDAKHGYQPSRSNAAPQKKKKRSATLDQYGNYCYGAIPQWNLSN